MERRYKNGHLCLVGYRAEDMGPIKINGLAGVIYNGTPDTQFELWPGGVERIMQSAFDRAVLEDDVRALFNHDPNKILGRTSAGTLRLSVSGKGLEYDIDAPNTAETKALVEAIERRDVTGSSFSFSVTDERWRKEASIEIREILGVELYDVGPVTFPAYEATTATLRKEGDVAEARASFERFRGRLTSYRRVAESIGG